MRPGYLKLFAEADRPAVQAKLTAYHMRMGTELFLGLSDYTRFILVTRCVMTGHDRIDTRAENWSEKDTSRYGDIRLHWEELQRLRALEQIPPVATTSSETQTTGKITE